MARHVLGPQLVEFALYLGTMVEEVEQFFVGVIGGLSCRLKLDAVIHKSLYQ